MRTDPLTKRYVVALSMVALLSICGQVIVQFALSRQQVDSAFVNIAGRQRMLSQRVTQLTLRLYQSVDRAERARLRADLAQVLDGWQAAHRALREGDAAVGTTATPSDTVNALLAQVGHDLNTMTRAAQAVATADGVAPTTASAQLAVLLAHEVTFLERMDAIVFRAADEAAERVITLRVIELILLTLVLTTLTVEGVFIFRPAVRAVTDALARLKASTTALTAIEQQKSALIAALPDLLIRVDAQGRCVETLTTPTTWTAQAQAMCPLPGDPLSPALAQVVQTALAEGHASTEICLDHGPRELALELRMVALDRTEALVLARDVSDLRSVERAVLDASEAVRRDVGRELHDGLCQDLAALHIMTRRAADRAARGDTPPAGQLAQLSDLVEHTLESGRRLSRGLYPIDLDDGGLTNALRGLCQRVGTAHGQQIEADVMDALTLSPPVALHLYRIAQEALGNAMGHAQAARVQLQLVRTPDAIELHICDDGHGRLPSPAQSPGLGLRSMRYRAQLVHATLTVRAQPGTGTRISCILPLSSLALEPTA